jgi:hypothetical protein
LRKEILITKEEEEEEKMEKLKAETSATSRLVQLKVPVVTVTSSTSTALVSSQTTPPTIFINDDSAPEETTTTTTGNNDINKINKCQSMQNIKLTNKTTTNINDEEGEKYRKNLMSFNNKANNNQNNNNSSNVVSRRNFNYRKCLSRINLNLYNQQAQLLLPVDDEYTNRMGSNQANLEFVRKRSSNLPLRATPMVGSIGLKNGQTSISIMNLENMALTSDTNSNNNESMLLAGRRNFKLKPLAGTDRTVGRVLANKSVTNLANLSAQQSATFGGGGMFNCRNLAVNQHTCPQSSSSTNLFKSSTSLNALDLDLMDSVSVGSFDRFSFYSFGANSESDLTNALYVFQDTLIDTTARNDEEFAGENSQPDESLANFVNQKQQQPLNNDNNTYNSNNLTSIVDTYTKMGSFKENRVIDWLGNI